MAKNVKLVLFIIMFISGFAMENKKEKNEDYEIYVNQIVESFAKKMNETYGLSCCGSGGRMPYDVEEIGIKFVAYQRATIEEARKLEVNVTELFLKEINSNEKIRPFLRVYPFDANRGRVSISFMTKDNKQYTDGSVAYVTQVKNKISYCADNENSPRLIPLMDEPYEEALKIVNETTGNN